jgi:hypothetical protein
VTVFFLLWFLLFLSLKKLVLAEYQIRVGVVGTASSPPPCPNSGSPETCTTPWP